MASDGKPRPHRRTPEDRNMSNGRLTERTADDELRIARALAIEAYAGVESALVVLLGRLLGTTNDLAAIVFFRITNSRATSKIIEQLLEKAHGTKYDTYWHGQPGAGGQRKIPGLFALIRQLNEKRNDIVHWHIRSSSSSTGDQWDDLTPAYYWTRGHQEPITTPDLNAFIEKAKFVQSSIFHFCQFTTKASDVFLRAYGGKLETWTRIFEDQPAVYPPSEDHPLAPRKRSG
jgi:hypothetical protein